MIISADFEAELRGRRVRTPTTVVENWFPLSGADARDKRNDWSNANGLADTKVALYAGTLGLKHDPEHLVAAAKAVADIGARVVVATEGLGRRYLEAAIAKEGLVNLTLVDFVPFETLPDLVATADVCLVLLEPTAGVFSVPSKVLAYLAAGRPVVGAMPRENLAARTVMSSGAGCVVSPGDYVAFGAAIRHTLANEERTEAGLRARAYALSHFAIGPIADKFERVMFPTVPGRR